MTVTNCLNTGTIEAGDRRAGGIIGSLEHATPSATITNCVNKGAVTVKVERAGGIVGTGDITRNGTGRVTISYCKNEGNITSNGSDGGSRAGGIAGGGINNTTFENCFNFGNISGPASYIGGIVGSTNGYSRISKCYNQGAINTGRECAGGIVGSITGVQERAEKKNYATVENCFNKANIYSSSTDSDDQCFGGIVGLGKHVVINACGSIANVTGPRYTGGIVGAFSTYSWENSNGKAYDNRAVVKNCVVAGKMKSINDNSEAGIASWVGFSDFDTHDNNSHTGTAYKKDTTTSDDDYRFVFKRYVSGNDLTNTNNGKVSATITNFDDWFMNSKFGLNNVGTAVYWEMKWQILPQIILHPFSVLKPDGDTVNLEVVTYGGGLTYQWYKNTVNSTSGGTAISGATSATYTATVTSDDTWYYCKVYGEDSTGAQKIETSRTALVGTGTYKVTTLTKPTKKGAYTYNGNEQTLQLNNFDSALMTITGNKKTDAGNYTATISLKNTETTQWEGGSTDPIDISWTIAKATPEDITLNPTSLDLTYKGDPKTIAVTRTGDGAVSVSNNSDNTIASTSVNGTTITVTPKLKGETTLTISVAEGKNYKAPESVTIKVTVSKMTLTVPSQKNTLTYNGNEQSVTWNNYNTTYMKIASGSVKETNAGTYKATFELLDKNNTQWSGGTTTNKEVSWTIGKATPAKVTLSPTSLSLTYKGDPKTIEVTRTGDGVVSVSNNSDNTIASTSVSGTTITVTPKLKGETTLTISVAESKNYKAPASVTIKVTVSKLTLTVPSQKNTLTYNGKEQSVTWNNYNTTYMKIASGAVKGTNAGTYKATFELLDKNNTQWSGGTTTNKEVSWTIEKANPAAVTLDPSSLSFTYGDSAKTVTVTRDGNGSITVSKNTNSAVATTSVSGNKITVTPGKVGTTTLTISVAEGDNYKAATSVKLTVTVNTRVLEIPSQKNTLTYNGKEQSVTWNNYNTTYMKIASGTVKGTNAGTYKATFELLDKNNTQWSGGTTTNKEVSWTIGKATPTAVTLDPSSLNFTYGDSAKTVTVTRDGNGSITVSKNTNSAVATTSVSGNKITVTPGKVGTTTLTISVAEGDNYKAAQNVTLNVTVSIKTLTIPSQKGTLTYNGKEQSVTWNNYNTTYMKIASGAVKGTNAGTYKATFELLDKNNTQWSGGTTTNKEVSWSIGKATPAAVTLDPSSLNFTYGDSAKTVTVTRDGKGTVTVSNNTNSNAATASVSGTTITVTPINVGKTTLTISVAEDTNFVAAQPVTLVVNVDTRVLAIPSQSGELTYNGSRQAPEWKNYDTKYMTIGGTKDAINAGTHQATFSLKSTTNTKWSNDSTATQKVDWKINKKKITPITVTKSEYEYTGAAFSMLYTGFDSTIMTIAGKGPETDAGDYVATVSFINTTNYMWSDNNSSDPKTYNWKIKKSTKGSMFLSDSELIFTYADPSKIVTVTRSGDGAVSVSANSDPSVATTTVSGTAITVTPKNVGETILTVSVAEGSNYFALPTKTIKVIVNKLAIPLPSQKGTLTYNGKSQSPVLNNYIEGQITLAGDTSGIDAISYNLLVTPTSNFKWQDNSITAKTVPWKIDTKKISTVWGETTTFVYNGKGQAPDATVNSGVTGETILLNVSKNINVGKYTSIATLASVNGGQGKVSNYTLQNVEKAYEIIKKDVRVVWENLEFVYNTKEQAPTATVDSGVEGETIILEVTSSINAGEHESIASMLRVEGGQKLTSNYNLLNTSVRFLINKAPISPTIKMEGYEYGLGKKLPQPSLTDPATNPGNGEVIYYYNETDSNSNGKEWRKVTSDSYLEPGTYWMYATVAETANYLGATTPTVKFVIGRPPRIEVDSNTTYSKSQTATVTIYDPDKDIPDSDNDKYIKEGEIVLEYVWTQSKTTPTEYTNSTKITVGPNTSVVETKITKNTDSGIWYLHVKGTVEDAVGYKATHTVYGTFYLDNTKPTFEFIGKTNTVYIDQNDTVDVTINVKDIHAETDQDELTKEDIVVYVAGEKSTAEKNLIHVSYDTNEKVRTYKLTLSNVPETGYIELEILDDAVTDNAGNSSDAQFYDRIKVNIFVDNKSPIILQDGETKIISVSEGKNLNNLIEPQYISKEYEIEIPITVTDVGTDVEMNLLSANEILILLDGNLADNAEKTLIENGVVSYTEDDVTKIKTYTRKYMLNVKGIKGDGYLDIKIPQGSVNDIVGNVNIEKTYTPLIKTLDNKSSIIYVDNTRPRIMIQEVITDDLVNKDDVITVILKVIDNGAGIHANQFVLDDILIQINGGTVQPSEVKLIPNINNNHDTELGKDEETNYTYELKISGIEASGSLRFGMDTNKIVDKANNGNETITLTAQVNIDNEGPKLGKISSNADEQNEVIGQPVIVKIVDCVDESGIGEYVWQRSKDKKEWEDIKVENSSLSTSTVEQEYHKDNIYYYRVIVSDKLGNSSISDVILVIYRNSISTKPTIRLTQKQISSDYGEIEAVIKSNSRIEQIKVNGSIISPSKYENNIQKNNYEYTTTMTTQVTSNGIYQFEVIDEYGNAVIESINISMFDTTKSVITYTAYNATFNSNAKIIFTSNEPFRIISKNGYSGITFLETNFATVIEATISSGEKFDTNRTFIFENKGLLPTEVEVKAPIITKYMYVRFDKISTSDLALTIKEIATLVASISSSKTINTNGLVESYYGFNKTNIKIEIASKKTLDLAETLGKATETFIIDEKGQKVKLQKEQEIQAPDSSNYTNGNVSGMYKKTSGLLVDFDGQLSESTTKYGTFRIILIP